jgi:hypothetical protein
VGWLAGARTPPKGLVAGTSPVEGADKPGVIAWRPAGIAVATKVAVNVDPREFDPARQDTAAFVERVPREGAALATAAEAVAQRQEAAQGLWRYGLGLMLVSLVVESLIGRHA